MLESTFESEFARANPRLIAQVVVNTLSGASVESVLLLFPHLMGLCRLVVDAVGEVFERVGEGIELPTPGEFLTALLQSINGGENNWFVNDMKFVPDSAKLSQGQTDRLKVALIRGGAFAAFHFRRRPRI